MNYKYIHFVKIADKPKTSVWGCINNTGDYEIGIVKWNAGWRQYCFFPAPDMVFSNGCLQDICTFVESISKKGKQDTKITPDQINCSICGKERHKRYENVCIHCGAIQTDTITKEVLSTQQSILLRINRCPHPGNSYICDMYGDDCEWCIKSYDGVQ